jgi:hypothetical protein
MVLPRVNLYERGLTMLACSATRLRSKDGKAMKMVESEYRKRNYGEVRTPSYIVKEMLDLLPEKKWAEKDLIFLEPTCGNGQFLVQAVARKMDAGLTPEEAVNTTFGLEILKDNVEESRLRVLEVVLERLKKQKKGPQTDRTERIAAIICHNIFKVKDSLEFMTKKIFDEWFGDYPFFDEDPTGAKKEPQVLSKEDRKTDELLGKALMKARLENEFA